MSNEKITVLLMGREIRQYVLILHGKNDYANAPRCRVISRLPVLLNYNPAPLELFPFPLTDLTHSDAKSLFFADGLIHYPTVCNDSIVTLAAPESSEPPVPGKRAA